MPRIRTAHKFNERQRTGDVLTDELVDFKSLLLSPDVLKGLNSSGFERPSPIQLKAIPLGRCGLDLISQAKSGTGKTCVFSVIALESLLLESNTTQVLILAPTREIAVQIKDVISAIGSQMDNMVCQVFIGGLPVDENKKMLKKPCHIAVGTPGRIKYLIENHFLKTESVRLFILDEADKLLEDNFQEQINWIFSALPSNKQMMAFSATYPEYLAKHLTRYMREPTFVRLNASDPTLQGMKQFHRLVPFHPLPHKTFQEKVTELLKLLSSLSFHQCLVFSNYQIRAQSLCDTLRLKGWPSVFIAGSQTQSQRLKAMERLKQFKCRVLISTDLTSRGIDAENVNLVVNMDVPRDSETYLHRIGRAGRFGTQGVAVSFVARGEEDKLFKKIEESIGTTTDELPDPIPQSLGTAGNSTDLDCASVQARTASIEVDILKCNSMRDSEENVNLTSSHFDKNQISASTKLTESVNADREIIFVGDQRSDNADQADKESIKNGVEILSPNQLPLQEVNMESVAVLTSDAEREEISNIEERLQTSLCLHQQNCKDENICDKSVDHTGQNNSVSQTQTNEAYFIAAPIVCDASICHDGKEKESKTEHRPPSQLGSSAENSSEVNASLSKLQVDLKHFSQFDTRSCHKEETNVLNRASKQSDCIKPSSKEETVDGRLARPSEDERNSSGLQSEENNSIESDESSDSLEFDERETSDRVSEQDHFLPSVEQFEEDFKEYLENVSNVVDNSIELPQASELADDGGIYSEHKLHSDFKDDGYHHGETPTDAHAASQQFDTQPDTYHQMLHQDSYSTGYCNEQNVQGLHQTDLYYSAFHDNILPEGGWNSLHRDQCDWFSDHNYYHDQSYNNYYSPFYGHHVANWWANAPRHPDSASSQQCPSQFYGDIGSYQDYQWNMSWYNAYQRQTSCIRQFVSFSRSARM